MSGNTTQLTDSEPANSSELFNDQTPLKNQASRLMWHRGKQTAWYCLQNKSGILFIPSYPESESIVAFIVVLFTASLQRLQPGHSPGTGESLILTQRPGWITPRSHCALICDWLDMIDRWGSGFWPFRAGRD